MPSNNTTSLRKYSSEKGKYSSENTVEKFEVVIDQKQSEPLISLKKSVWIDGLGWSVQKTIQLDPDQLDELSRAIIAAKHHLLRHRAQQGEPETNEIAPIGGKIIRMPVFVTPTRVG
ncbi:MAG: hypothetical protein ACRD63_04830 [Pyrinomonadaceae bacterium]